MCGSSTSLPSLAACFINVVGVMLMWSSSGAAVNSMSAQEVYTALREGDDIRNVTLTEPFNLAHAALRLRPGEAARRTILFDHVNFAHGLEARGSDEVVAHLVFRDVEVQSIVAQNVTWRGKVTFAGGAIHGWAVFDRNTFDSVVEFKVVQFHGGVDFRGTVFARQVDFLQCTFVGDGTAGFSNVHFLGPAHFNESAFSGLAKFVSAVFDGDASFVRIRANKAAVFHNVMFRKDAEFRFATMHRADFGDQAGLTVFYGLADFRGSEINQARFDFVDFRQTTSFVNAHFGPGGASFLNANFDGPLANFEGVASQGPLVLTGAYMPTLRFHWYEVGPAVLASRKIPEAPHRDRRIPVLEQLWRRLGELGRPEEALQAYYYLAELRRQETLARSDVSRLDKVGVWGEWVLWGLPTGYGTKFGRILLVALASWMIFTLPFLLRKRSVLIRVPFTVSGSGQGLTEGASPWLCAPVYRNELPTETALPGTFFERLQVALSFSFALMFKIRWRGIRYFERDRQTTNRYFRAYLCLVWFLGLFYLALLGLTLANTSPALSKLIGKFGL